MKKYVILIFLAVLSIGYSLRWLYFYDKTQNTITNTIKYQNPCLKDIDFEKTEEVLKTLAVKEKTLIKEKDEDSNTVFLLVLENGLKAIFKPNRNVMTEASELRAYHLSKLLGLKSVPPTVRREINGEVGLVRFYVEGTFLEDDYAKDSFYLENIVNNPDQKEDIYILLFLLGEFSFDSVLEDRCSFLALVDLDINLDFLTAQEHENHPYIYFPYLDFSEKANQPSLDLIVTDYKKIPFDQVKSIKNISSMKPTELIKSVFKNTKRTPTFFNDIEDLILELSEYYDYDTLYYIKWKKGVWLKIKTQILYQELIPFTISEEKLKKLKELNYNNLNTLSSKVKSYFNMKERKKISHIEKFNKILFYKKQHLYQSHSK